MIGAEPPSEEPRLDRVPRWRLTGNIAASAVVALLSLIWFGVALRRGDPPRVGWVLPMTAVLIAAWSAWRAGTPQSAGMPHRYFWRYVAVGVTLIGAGSVSNGYDYLHGGRYTGQVSGLTSTIYLCGLLVMMIGLLRIPGTRRSRAEWARFGLDIATVIVTVLTFSWHLLYPTWVAGGLGGTWSALAVVGGGFICVFAFIKVAFTGTGAIDRRALHLLGLTGAVGAGGGATAPLLAAFPGLANGPVLIPVVCLVLCLAVDRQLRTASRHPASRPLSGRPSIMPYTAVLFTGTLLLLNAQDRAEDIFAVAVGAVTVTVLVAIRQIMALRDNSDLVAHLDARLTELGEYQQQLAHQATHDKLTGLANRSVLDRDAAAALAADPAQVGVALIDLDNFKIINDDLGHAVGDALLKAVAARTVAHVPPGTTVARLGGDEYVLLFRTGSTEEHEAALIRLTDELRRPLSACGHDLVIGASIGLAPAGDGADTPDELLRRADVAMYEAKGQGRASYVVYTPEMDQRSAEQARIAADLRIGLDTGQLHLLYQPIVAIADGSFHGAEALVRWNHPQRGPVGPVDFIPAAERTGLIVPLGAWVLDEACRQAVRWQQELGSRAPHTVSVNVSARQLRETGFAADVAAVLLRTGLAPDRLTIEVTETAVFDGGSALAELHAVKALGVTVALDDFGTGHSSLGLLRTCPVDTLKVDKSFVDDITAGGHQAVIAEALIHISNGLQLRAVAEGVETAEQAETLYRLGYRYAQGYHYARPLPAAEISRRLGEPVARLAHSA